MTEQIQIDGDHLNKYNDIIVVTACILLTFFMGIGLVLLAAYIFYFRSKILILPNPTPGERQLSYTLTDDGIEMKDFWVIMRTQKLIPWKKVVGIDLFQGPVMHYCDVSCIRIMTAAEGYGTRSVTLIGIKNAQDVYESIRARII